MRFSVGLVFLVLGFSQSAWATPQFARELARDCAACHLAPPVLNEAGEEFIARGYRFDTESLSARRTFPLAVWNTVDLERRSDVTKGFPGRVELISAGNLGSGGAAYFAEWRLLSQQVGAGNRLLDRSGRFEDLFITIPFGRSQMSVTVGQFRALTQTDVSRRLSISEPLVFSASVPGSQALSSARLTSLRGFSPSGRQPAVRLGWQKTGDRVADGWFGAVTVPLTGELTTPLTAAASFELEARPKGVFLETFRRAGLASVGGHAFIGDDRSLVQGVAVAAFHSRLLITAVGGMERLAGASDARLGAQLDAFVNRYVAVGARLEDRTGPGRRRAGILVFNGHLPFGPPAFRQALRLQIEQRLQSGASRTLAALSHIF